MRIPKVPFLILIFSLLSAPVIGIDASVGMFVFLIIGYIPLSFVVSRIINLSITDKLIKPRRPNTKEFDRLIDEDGDYHE